MFSRLLLLLAVVVLPVAAHAAPAKDWSREVVLTPEGAHQLGNPAAKARLIEYVSYTCSHCAHFVTEASAPLKSGWVANGALVVEVRNLVRDRYDFAAALLARCGGPTRFIGNHEALFAHYDAWIAQVRVHATQPPAIPHDASPAIIMTDIAEKTGLIALMQKRGISPAQSRACLADTKAAEAVLAMTKYGVQQDGITGTPGFVLNGKKVAAFDWATLRPVLPTPAK
ncbi:MAG: thioredoxin domain-containing protein [Sphingobium sp.]|nr:thioredoxin domain-containing protein [Sphingobium sp.]MCP5399247.1 thioredoxin domain-containing protein [Sphingomonas sp.]